MTKKEAKTNADRQAEFRNSRALTHKKLEVWLPNDEAMVLSDNAKNKGLTKADYVISLLHDNGIELLPDNDNQDEVTLLKLRLETANKNLRQLEHESKHLLSGKRFKDIPPLEGEQVDKPPYSTADIEHVNKEIHRITGKEKLSANYSSKIKKEGCKALGIDRDTRGKFHSNTDALRWLEWLKGSKYNNNKN